MLIILRRLIFVYGGLLAVRLLLLVKRMLLRTGEFFKSLGRRLTLLGEDRTAHWGTELLLRCYLVDAEFHVDDEVYRGPVYAVHRSFTRGDLLVFRCNWIATRQGRVIEDWEYAGGCAFRFEDFSMPTKLPNGDYYFGFRGGYGILFLGKPRSRLSFLGQPDTPREFVYY